MDGRTDRAFYRGAMAHLKTNEITKTKDDKEDSSDASCTKRLSGDWPVASGQFACGQDQAAGRPDYSLPARLVSPKLSDLQAGFLIT